MMITSIETFTVIACGECGVNFALADSYIKARREDHATWHCPNGHRRYYSGDNELERTKAALERARIAEADAVLERRRAAAYKGHLTRQRRLMSNGVCPHPGCRRNFVNVRQHMLNQHPELLTELEEATK